MSEQMLPPEILAELNADRAQQEKPISDLVESNLELGRFLSDVENGSATDGGIMRYVEKWNTGKESISGSYTDKSWETPSGGKLRMRLDTNGNSELIFSKE